MPGPMESAKMLMTENTPLMMPKDRPETTKGERSQPRVIVAVLPPPRAPDLACGPREKQEKVGKAALAQQAHQHCHWLLIPEHPTARQPQKSMGRSATAQALPRFVLTVSHLPEGDGGPAILADCCQAFIRFPAQAGEKV